MEKIEDLSPLAAYRHYCRQGKLAYQFCPDDGAVIFFPRTLSPKTGSRNLEWRVSEGLGTVYASTTVHRRGEDPYNVSLIDIDEGYRMMSRVENLNPDDVKPGMRVRVRMAMDDDGQPYPVFAPEEMSK